MNRILDESRRWKKWRTGAGRWSWRWSWRFSHTQQQRVRPAAEKRAREVAEIAELEARIIAEVPPSSSSSLSSPSALESIASLSTTTSGSTRIGSGGNKGSKTIEMDRMIEQVELEQEESQLLFFRTCLFLVERRLGYLDRPLVH